MLNYSETSERAQLFDVNEDEDFKEEEDLDETSVQLTKPRKKKTKKRKGIDIVQGHIYLKLAGFEGEHRLSTSQLVKFIPLKNLKKYAVKVLRDQGVKRKRRKKKTVKKLDYFLQCPH